MMFVQDRETARRFFQEAWRKRCAGLPLEPLETMVAEIVARHPEYHRLLESGESALGAEFTPEGGQTNPFLHMGMHIAIQEQISTDRPPGIAAAYRRLLPQFRDAHDLDHRLMECLGEALWKAQRNNTAPDEQAYLECVRRLGRTMGAEHG